MSESAVLQLETIEDAFSAGLLLTGSIEQAEPAIVSSVHCIETGDVCGQRVFRRVIQWSVDSPEPQRSLGFIDEASVRTLPFELGRVLYLPSDLRHCYVLRILRGLSREVCAWLLHADDQQISKRTESALDRLAGVYTCFGGSDLGSRVAQQRRQELTGNWNKLSSMRIAFQECWQATRQIWRVHKPLWELKLGIKLSAKTTLDVSFRVDSTAADALCPIPTL